MCQIVVINRGEKELTTPRHFLEHFGCLPLLYSDSYSELDLDCCLCQADLEATFESLKIDFKTDCMDFYVGKLDELNF